MPYRVGVPELTHWEDREAALLRLSEKEWEYIKTIPGYSGNPEFDKDMALFLAEAAAGR